MRIGTYLMVVACTVLIVAVAGTLPLKVAVRRCVAGATRASRATALGFGLCGLSNLYVHSGLYSFV